MIISRNNHFIFAAFNKTGTTSIERVLAPYNTRLLHRYLRFKYKWLLQGSTMFKHVRPYDLRQMLGESEWDRYFTFSFVRNPWSRAVSLYFFHRKGAKRWPLAQKSFGEWILAGGTGTVRRSMSEFVSDDDGTRIVDFVGRYENLVEDFRLACERAGLPELELPYANRSTSGNYRQYYNDETREIVGQWSKRDIEEFDYRF